MVSVRGYRGGYLPLERRAIEAALRDGSLRGVVATNALELGIDIGSLDACFLIGYPGTIASTWQQAGRAGRRSDQAIAILVASSDPLDQFIVRHPEYFFGRSPEHALANPDNPLILLDHLRCALFELPFCAEEASQPFGAEVSVKDAGGAASLAPGEGMAGDESAPGISGGSLPSPLVGDLLRVLEAEGNARRAGDRWFWLGDTYPAAGVSLRACGAAPVEIVLSPSASEGADGREAQILGTVERDAAAVTVHEGAIYLHDGAAYRVERLDWQGGRAYVAPDEGLLYSVANSTAHFRPVEVLEQRAGTRCSVFHGLLEVRSRAVSYRLIRLLSGETVGWGTIELPESVNVAGAYWFTLEEEATSELAAIGQWRSDAGDRGPNWAEQRDRARARDGYACAVCRTPEPPHRAHQVHHIRPFSTFGWQPGKNEAYKTANDLDNLITLCPACHRLAERTLGLQGGLAGIGHALSHLAPLFLMCDRRDLAVHAESCAAWTGRPTITIFERAQAGVGFGRQLYELHDRLVLAAADLIAECPCESGCPSCVGPSGQLAAEAKKHAQLVLRLLVPGRDQS